MILGFCIFFCNFVQAFLIQNFLIKFFGTKSVWGHVARDKHCIDFFAIRVGKFIKYK